MFGDTEGPPFKAALTNNSAFKVQTFRLISFTLLFPVRVYNCGLQENLCELNHPICHNTT